MTELNKLTIKKIKNGLENKDFTAQEVTQSFFDAINRKNDELNAYVYLNEEYSINQSKIADKNIASGTNKLLEGIPIAVKDLFCTKNIPTTSCSNILKNFVPTYESTVTSNLFKNGAVMLGKTNMDEFAMGSATDTGCFGSTKSPWKNQNNEHTAAGGSSGGSSSAVAAMLAPGALGSDTGGSVRQPASFTGTVGFKPSYGRCSRWGMISFASSLDQAGVITRTVEDAALLAQAIMGYDNKDSTISNLEVPNLIDDLNDINIKGMKIALPREYHVKDLPEEIEQMWDNAVKLLKQLGAEVNEVSLPNTKYGLSAYYIIAPAEASSNLSRYDGVRFGQRVAANSLDEMYELTRASGFGDEVKRRIMVGTYVLSSDKYEECFLQAQKVRRLIANDFYNVFNDYDAIITPTCISEAFSLTKKLTPIEMYKNDIFTIPASLAGLPCISIPAMLSKNKLPLGLQLITNRFEESKLIKIANALEKALGFSHSAGDK